MLAGPPGPVERSPYEAASTRVGDFEGGIPKLRKGSFFLKLFTSGNERTSTASAATVLAPEYRAAYSLLGREGRRLSAFEQRTGVPRQKRRQARTVKHSNFRPSPHEDSPSKGFWSRFKGR